MCVCMLGERQQYSAVNISHLALVKAFACKYGKSNKVSVAKRKVKQLKQISQASFY